MKQVILFTALFLMAWIVSITSCKKDREVSYPPPNLAPVAMAGPDISVQLSSCSDRSGIAELDGSASSDPDGYIASYTWKRIYGPPGGIVLNSNSAKASIEHISPGEYGFELVVRGEVGLISRDTVLMFASGEATEYDLDLTFGATYIFRDSTTNCGGWYDYYTFCEYKSTTIFGRGFFSPIGEFSVFASEEDVTDAAGNRRSTFIHIYLDNINSVFISGTCSVNFNNLIQQGGGSFAGTFQINNGSALSCDPNVFKNLPELSVTGNLDIAAKSVTLRVKGKVYF